MPAFAIQKPVTAFAFDPSSRKTKRIEDPKHLAFIRLLPSVISGERPCEACHIRAGNAVHRKVWTGAGRKPDDPWCLPLTPEEHRTQHDMGDELAFWRLYEIDPFELAVRLYEVSGDIQAAEQIIRKARA